MEKDCKRKIKIVYPSKFSKDHLLSLPSNFSYYMGEIMENGDFEVYVLNSENGGGNLINRTIRMVRDINRIKPDILYLTLWMGYNNLVVARLLRLIQCKIVIWKYTNCVDSNMLLFHWFFKYLYWPTFSKVYMMFDNHTEIALKKKLLNRTQVKTLSRGVDLKWYSQFVIYAKNNDFRLIATGKDNRDYFTLCKACEETQTCCDIITFRHSNCVKAAEQYIGSKYVHFIFMDSGYDYNSYTFVVKKVASASAMAICCERLPYGAGYTNIVESLAFKIPIIQTLNPDVHLDPEKEGIGFSVLPYDVEGWKSKIAMLKADKGLRDKMAANIQRLLDGEYNSVHTAAFIMNDFKSIVG